MTFLYNIARLSLLLATIFPFASFCQRLSEVKSYPIPTGAVWTVDGLENIIISERERLTKYDKDGRLLFEQSQKSLGRFDKVGLVNSLKIYTFSESQQLVCFFDNSLTMLEKCMDLSEYDLVNVSLVAGSGQSDKMWVFDQVNSTLHLLSFSGLLQTQAIKNLNGILNTENITQLVEWENKLFVLDNQRGIYVFDLYGTLIRFIEIENVKWIQLYNGYVICLRKNELKMISLSNEKRISFPLDYQEVKSIRVDDNFIYLRSPETIIKARFVFD